MQHRQRQAQATVGTAVILLLFFGLALFSLKQKSPTFDEQGFVVRGLGYLRGENRHMRNGHPLGLNALNALFLWPDTAVALPTDHPSWQETSFHRPAELFLWEIGNNVEHVMFLARLPTVWLGMLLCALVGRWAREISGRRWAGLLALALIALDPNVLAHSRLATTDLGLALGAAVAGYTLWRYLIRPGWQTAVLAGVGFGLLNDTKFTAGLFIPLFGLVILVTWLIQFRRGPQSLRRFVRQRLSFIILFPLISFIMLWASYGFQVGTLPENLPMWSQLGGVTLPLAHHWEQLLDIGNRTTKGAAAFLLGNYSNTGWWYYFPVTFLLKTPLPILLLLLWSGWYAWRRWQRETAVARTAVAHTMLLIPPLGYLAIALTTTVNVGYRHLLPMLPFLAVFMAVTLARAVRDAEPSGHIRRRLIYAAWLVPVLVAFSTITLFPDFLAYFNLLAGGPDNGWRYLVDSNLDWGQDLNRLKQWMDEEGVDQVWLSYFGEARPAYYGINTIGLDSFPPRLMHPDANPYYPHDPASGVYAISATNLQGVLFENHDQFYWFRDKEPVAVIGHSIFVYEVAPYGEAADLALGHLPLTAVDPADFALFGTNDIRPRWFEAANSVLIPSGERSWIGLGQASSAPLITYIEAELTTFETAVSHPAYTLYRVSPPAVAETVAVFRKQAHVISLKRGLLWSPPVDGRFTWITVWEQESTAVPVKIFVHVTTPDGQIVTQWDGLGVIAESWRSGDYLVQAHEFTLPTDAPDGPYQVWAGLYHPETGLRWQTEDGQDRWLLGTLPSPNPSQREGDLLPPPEGED